MMKVGVFGLGMLGCFRRFYDLLAAEKDVAMDLASTPQDDADVYDMI